MSNKFARFTDNKHDNIALIEITDEVDEASGLNKAFVRVSSTVANNIALSEMVEVETQPDSTAQELIYEGDGKRISAVFVNFIDVETFIGNSPDVTPESAQFVLTGKGSWFEDDNSQSAWYGVTEGDTADIRVTEVKTL